jgi:hypothetical protein
MRSGNRDHLDLGHRLKSEPPAEPADAALRSNSSAERQVDFPVRAALIDVDDLRSCSIASDI